MDPGRPLKQVDCETYIRIVNVYVDEYIYVYELERKVGEGNLN